MNPVDHRSRLRRDIRWILAFGLIGLGSELILIDHLAGFWQIVPLAAITVSLLVLLWSAARPSRASLAGLRLGMIVLIAAGGTGLYHHYRSNQEFKMEMDPSLEGFPLFITALRSQSPPSLAPAGLILLAGLGLASGRPTVLRESPKP